jgi:hypothetical protein
LPWVGAHLMHSINWLAIVAAAATNFFVGGLWYSPALFIKPWMAMSGVSKAVFDAGLPKALIVDLLASLAMALGLNQVLRLAGVNDIGGGLAVAFWVWLAFIAAVLIGTVTHEHRPLKFFLINAGYRLVTLLIMSIILAPWH